MNPSHGIKLVIAAAAVLLLLPSFSGAITGITTLCNGTTTTNGIIPHSAIIGAGSSGVASVLGLTIVIMLVVLLVCAGLYMLGKLTKLPSLENFIKVELAEMVATMIIVGIFFGAFYASALAATSGHPGQSTQFGGSGRAVFVQDCMVLGNSSIALIPPVMSTGTVSFLLGVVDSFNIKIAPGGFGISDTPLAGMAIIPSTLDQLQEILSVLVVGMFAIIFILGVIYGLFPLFLYLGIILRAFPWTRAMGGMFIALFIGYYVIFPMMLNATLSGFGAMTYQQSVSYYNSNTSSGINAFDTNTSTSNTVGYFSGQSTNITSSGGLLNYYGGLLASVAGYPNSYGVINGFIADFLGQGVMIAIEIALCFIIALDMTDILADLLGAPSLTAQRVLSKVL